MHRERNTYPYTRPRVLGPWAATSRTRSVSSRMPRAERMRATAYPRDRAQESRPRGRGYGSVRRS
eukprot:7809997-Pyramimonas_sp.AAC.1